MKLLSAPMSNPKIAKNMKQLGVLTAPLHLAPYDLSGYQVCAKASKGCAAACLNTAGRGKFDKIQQARIRKTKLFYTSRETFMSTLIKDIQALERKAKKESLSCAVRLNATSDIPWETYPIESHGGKNIFELFPNVRFYDYTAIWKRARTTKDISNYHLTFSLKEDNDKDAEKALLNGLNVAVVFQKELPPYFEIGDTTAMVIDGDTHDYRPNDPKDGVIVGLKAKGEAKHDTTGFVRKGATQESTPKSRAA